jgi:hypothetical protein
VTTSSVSSCSALLTPVHFALGPAGFEVAEVISRFAAPMPTRHTAYDRASKMPDIGRERASRVLFLVCFRREKTYDPPG